MPKLAKSQLDKRPSKAPAPTSRHSIKSEVTRHRILSAAAAVFRQEGYSGAHLSSIAKLAEIQTGSMYYHFDSREDLVDALMDMGVARTHKALVLALDSLPKEAAHIDRLRVAIETHLLAILEQGDISSATVRLLWQVPRPVRQKHVAAQRAYAALWRKLLTAAQNAGAISRDVDLSVARMTIIGALNWSADWYRPRGALNAKQIAQQVSTMLLHGLET